VGCVFPMVVVTLLLHAEFGLNDHREEAPHFTKNISQYYIIRVKWFESDWQNYMVHMYGSYHMGRTYRVNKSIITFYWVHLYRNDNISVFSKLFVFTKLKILCSPRLNILLIQKFKARDAFIRQWTQNLFQFALF